MKRLRIITPMLIAVAILLASQPLVGSEEGPPEVIWVAETTVCPVAGIEKSWGLDDREPYAFKPGGRITEPVKKSAGALDTEKYRECMGLRQGLHVIELLINRQGSVEAIALRRGEKNCWLDELVRHYRSWDFSPATLDGVPVCVTYTITLRVGLQ